MTGASPEVLRHHAAQHPCPRGQIHPLRCPCGIALAIICPECLESVFLVVEPDTWCAHASQLQGGQPTGVWVSDLDGTTWRWAA